MKKDDSNKKNNEFITIIKYKYIKIRIFKKIRLKN